MRVHFLKKFRFRAWLARGLVGLIAGATLMASAQFDVSPTRPSSIDTFGGNPDTSTFIKIPPDTDDWTRHFRVGTLLGLNISADFKTRGAFNISGNQTASGIYDDGYVRVDNTGNAGGYTSFWGYNNASQYNAAAQTLTMHGAFLPRVPEPLTPCESIF